MTKQDYLQIKDNIEHYKLFYQLNLSIIILIVVAPFALDLYELATNTETMNQYIIFGLYIIAFIALALFRPFLRNNRKSRGYLYYRSFAHMVDNELKQEEVNYVVEQFKKRFMSHAKEVGNHLEVYFRYLTLKIYLNPLSDQELIDAVHKENRTTVNLFIAEKISEAQQAIILYYIPEDIKKFVINIGYDKSNRHFFFCANDIYNASRVEKSKLKLLIREVMKK